MKHLPLTPPFFPGLSLFTISLSPPSAVVQEDGELGLQSVLHTFPLPLLPSQGENTSRSCPPAWGPSHGRQSSLKSNVSASHGLQFFMNCFSLGPFHGTQSFGNRLFQRGFRAGSEVLVTNLLQSRVVFTGSRWILTHCGPPWAAGGQSASPWSSPQAVGEFLL